MVAWGTKTLQSAIQVKLGILPPNLCPATFLQKEPTGLPPTRIAPPRHAC